MNSPSLFRGLAAAGLSLAVTACGPQEEPSSHPENLAGERTAIESSLKGPRLSPDEARAAATARRARHGRVTPDILGITYVRPHGVRPMRMAYVVAVTTEAHDGVRMEELVYVDALDGSVLLEVPRHFQQ